MQPCGSEAKSKAFQRTIGTFIGAAFGLVMILVEYYAFDIQDKIIGYILISLMIIPVIYTTILINKKNASYFSCVVFLSVAVNHLYDANPYIFVLNRIVDTLIGIALAYFINNCRLPRKKQNETLFVSELDEVLLDSESAMSPYSKFELNRMLDHGAHFTIATMRPPAALIPVLRYASKQYPGYWYIKIYNKQACKKNMIKELQQLKGIDHVVTLGEKEQLGDDVIKGEDANQIVHNFKRAYEPYFWEKDPVSFNK